MEGSSDMYSKGSLIIHTLRSIINNDKLFFEMINEIQTKFKYKTVDSKEIEKFISEKSGINFSDFFEQYLKKNTIPKLSIQLEEGDFNDLKLTYRWTLGGVSAFKDDEYVALQPFFKMPVKVTVKKDVMDFINPTTEWQTIILSDMKERFFEVATDLFYIDTEIISVTEN
ncbi:MAG: hypothetical protein WBM13_04970, partial [Bacteroidia bacterium]